METDTWRLNSVVIQKLDVDVGEYYSLRYVIKVIYKKLVENFAEKTRWEKTFYKKWLSPCIYTFPLLNSLNFTTSHPFLHDCLLIVLKNVLGNHRNTNDWKDWLHAPSLHRLYPSSSYPFIHPQHSLTNRYFWSYMRSIAWHDAPSRYCWNMTLARDDRIDIQRDEHCRLVSIVKYPSIRAWRLTLVRDILHVYIIWHSNHRYRYCHTSVEYNCMTRCREAFGDWFLLGIW